jgi:hypothetical protein
MTPVELRGLDGRNLLAFLAALGTQVSLDRKAPGARLSWDARTFRPTIHLASGSDLGVGTPGSEEHVVSLVECGLRELARVENRFPWQGSTGKPPCKCGIGGDIKGISRAQLRQEALEPAARTARENPSDRSWADFVAGLASDAVGSAKKEAYTALCVITGDGHQHFLGFMRDLCGQVTAEHLKATLFAPWQYREEGRSFRWDPGDDRRYALRASDPSKGPDKKIPSMWGASRLAFEALACLPCHPMRRRLRTTGFEDERVFHWPLWLPPVSLSTLRGLLAHPGILERDAATLAAMDVFAIASSRKTHVDRKRTFGPASIWPVPTSARNA